MENNNIGSSILIILIVGLVCFIAYKIMSMFKFPKTGAMCLISGGVKTGKTTFGVALAYKEYKRVHRIWKIKKVFSRMFDRECPEEPLLYSNIPLKVPYVPITRELLQRKHRFRFGSVIYVCEASLVADSQLIKDFDLNNVLLLFNKLIGHSTHGGKIIYDTQQIGDVHYSIKRCLSEYFYIHHLVKWIPGFLVAYIREERYSDDGTVVNSYDADVEESLVRVIIPKKTWKLFDHYCFSTATDNLPVADNVIHSDDLKVHKLVSFRTEWDRLYDKKCEVKKDGVSSPSKENKEENTEKK